MGEAKSWKNRIVASGTADPEQLLANPFNYRRRPGMQREALRDSLDELGVIKPVIVNEVTGHLVDGHARIEEYLKLALLVSAAEVVHLAGPPLRAAA